MIKKTSAAVLLLIVLGCTAYAVLKATAMNPENTAVRLFKEAQSDIEKGDALRAEGKVKKAGELYLKALEKLKTLKENPPDMEMLQPTSPAFQRTYRRVAGCESPQAAVESLIGALEEQHPLDENEYLLYWDLEAFTAEIMGEHWDTLTHELQKKAVDFSHDFIQRYMKLLRSAFKYLQMSMGEAEIDGDHATVVTLWDNMGYKSEVLYLLKRTGGMWRTYDFEIAYFRNRFAAVGKEAFRRCVLDKDAAEFVASDGFKMEFEMMCIQVAMELDGSPSHRKNATLAKGPVRWIVVKETKVWDGDRVLVSLRPGTVVEHLGETREDGMIRIACEESPEGNKIEGWVSVQDVRKSER